MLCAANPSATSETRRELEQLVDDAASDTDAAAFTALATAVAEVRASHVAEVARAEAYPVRAEIEAFARSIANGVALPDVGSIAAAKERLAPSVACTTE